MNQCGEHERRGEMKAKKKAGKAKKVRMDSWKVESACFTWWAATACPEHGYNVAECESYTRKAALAGARAAAVAGGYEVEE